LPVESFSPEPDIALPISLQFQNPLLVILQIGEHCRLKSFLFKAFAVPYFTYGFGESPESDYEPAAAGADFCRQVEGVHLWRTNAYVFGGPFGMGGSAGGRFCSSPWESSFSPFFFSSGDFFSSDMQSA
jgi:hypothetical protein